MLDLSNHDAYEVLEFEWAEYNQLDPRGMVACSSGTAALHLALEAMRLPQGSEVVVPDLTMIAVPRAVTLAGLTPVFVDCDDTLNMDHQLAQKALDWNSRGVIYVHTYGKQCETRDIVIAECFRAGNGIIIEDSAEAHGVKPGPFTDAACWSFYKNKIVAGEEGGAVWFRNHEHAKLARQLRSLGFTDAHDFNHIPRGVNARMSNAHASLILDSLRRIDLSLENRWLQWHTYNELCPREWRMQRDREYAPDAPWVYAMKLPYQAYPTPSWQKVDEVVAELRTAGIEARHCFKPCHIQEEYKDCKMVLEGVPSLSKILSKQVIYLPLSSYHTKCHLEVFDVIQRILGK